MEPINVFASIIPVVETISSSYKTLQHIKGLPKAFIAVRNRLPVAEETLYLIQEALDSECNLQLQHKTDSDKQLLVGGFDDCHELLSCMDNILRGITAQASSMANWSGIIDSYRQIVASTGKGQNIETLTLLLLPKLRMLLANVSIRDNVVLSGQLRKLEHVCESLNEALSSLPASDSSNYNALSMHSDQSLRQFVMSRNMNFKVPDDLFD